MNSISFSWGVVIGLLLTAIIWLFMFWHHAKAQSQFSFGGVLISIGFISMAYRSYIVLITAHQTYSDKVMVSLFISTATFLAGSIVISFPYFSRKK